MVRTCLLLISLILLSGCSLWKPKTEYVVVKTPVFKCPPSLTELPELERPHLDILKLKSGEIDILSIPENERLTLIVNSYKSSIKQLQIYATQLERSLNISKSICRE